MKKNKNYNKSQLILDMAKKYKTSRAEATLIVQSVLDSIVRNVKKGGRVEIRGFGTFEMRRYRAYQGRNPQTGRKIQVKAKKSPFFKVGKFREQINNKK